MAQHIVITGLADGMGREAAKLLAANGHSIAGFDIDADGLASLHEELANLSAGRPAQHFLAPLNILDRPAILKFRDDVLARYGHVDTVLSNAGVACFGAFEEIDLEVARRCLEINVIGTAAVFQAFIPAMRVRNQGKLVAMSSLVGQIPFPFESIYSASKFAVEGMLLSMRQEVMPFGIQLALIQPAQVRTRFAAKAAKSPAASSPYRERVARFIARDNELIQSAPTPLDAARKMAAVVEAAHPALFNQIDAGSALLLKLNRFLPGGLRDALLRRHMDIA